MSNELTVRDSNLPSLPMEMSVEQVLGQIEKIQVLMQKGMKSGEHYGVIPGTSGPDGKPKPTLLKPGAEKLCLMFRFDPEYTISNMTDGDHLTILSTCTLYHIPTGARVGSGMGSCSTKESKYAYRKAARLCPECGKDAIIKGQAQYGGGWLCFKKKDGCGAKFKDGDPIIEKQETGRIENPDKADQYNTVLKMANKRSLVAAVLNATAASDIFTQDLEDIQDKIGDDEAAAPPSSDRLKDTDFAPPAQRAAFWKMVQRVKADGARTWLENRCIELNGSPDGKKLTIGQIKMLTEMLQQPEDESQEAPTADDDLNASFEAEQAAK